MSEGRREVHPVALLFPPLLLEERSALEASVHRFGVLTPVVVDVDDRIVDGRHRAEIAESLGYAYPTRLLPEGLSPWDYAGTVNLDRRSLTPQQRVAVLLHAEQEGFAHEITEIRMKARERIQSGEPQPAGGLGSLEAGKTAARIGRLVGVSKTTVEQVEAAARVGGVAALNQIKIGARTAQQILREAHRIDEIPEVQEPARPRRPEREERDAGALAYLDALLDAGAAVQTVARQVETAVQRVHADERERRRAAIRELIAALGALLAAVEESATLLDE